MQKTSSPGDYIGTFSVPWENLPTGMYDKIERHKPTQEEEEDVFFGEAAPPASIPVTNVDDMVWCKS